MANAVKGARNQSRGNTPLDDKIAETMRKAGREVPEHIAPLDTPIRRKVIVEKKVEFLWEEQHLGSVFFTTGDFRLKDDVKEGATTYTQILVDGRPDSIQIDVTLQQVAPDIRVFLCNNGVTELTGNASFSFFVPVTWSGYTPHTRQKDKDNFDLVLMDTFGRLAVLQISVTTRGGKFYLNVQESWFVQVVKTTVAIAKELGMVFHNAGNGMVAITVPIVAENAGPGTDFLKSMPGMGPELVQLALESGGIKPLENVQVAKWKPEEVPESLQQPLKDGSRLVGWVLWYNAVLQSGFVRGTDGKSYFIHFKEFTTGLEVPNPMQALIFTPKENEKGQVQATSIRPLYI